MPISVNWTTKVIYIPQNYLSPLGGNVYELDVDTFRLDLRALEDDEEGIVFLPTHTHNTQVTVGGVTLSRVIQIINGYTITFEDGQYAVNLEGANNNIADVANVNQVSIRSKNSAGMVTVISGSGVTEEDKTDIIEGVWDEVLNSHIISGSAGEHIRRLRGLNGEYLVAEYTFTGDDNTKIEFYQYDSLVNFQTHNKSDGLIGQWTVNTVYSDGKPTILKSQVDT